MYDTVVYRQNRYAQLGTPHASTDSMTTTQKANLEATRKALLAAARAYQAAYRACEDSVDEITVEWREVLSLDATDLEARCAAIIEDDGPLFEVDE